LDSLKDDKQNSMTRSLKTPSLKNLSSLLVGLSVIAIVLFLKPIQWQDDIASLSPVSEDVNSNG